MTAIGRFVGWVLGLWQDALWPGHPDQLMRIMARIKLFLFTIVASWAIIIVLAVAYSLLVFAFK